MRVRDNLLPSGYLHTDGARILDARNNPVLLAGVNWYGFDCSDMVIGGLDHRALGELCEQIADLGFNCLRLPYCVEAILDGPPLQRGLDRMAALRGRRPIEVLDAVIAEAGRVGLKVILASMRSDAGWSAQGNGLWYTEEYPEKAWIAAWESLARRYAGNDTVIGCDLRNEPGSPPMDARAWPRNGGALWGHRSLLPVRHPRDWLAAAERAGNTILAIHPDLLIIVEGVRFDPGGPLVDGRAELYWPGGNLTGVRAAAPPQRWSPRPVVLDVPGRLVYSTHDYGPDMYRGLLWCQPGGTARTPEACRDVWDGTWGFLVREGIAPVFLGEFGTPNGFHPSSPDARREDYVEPNERNPQGAWFRYLIDYVAELGVHWCYWCLNGTQSRAPARDPRRPDWYGVLAPNWTDIASPPMMEALGSILRRKDGR